MGMLYRVFNNICSPYNGEDLVWHPVTPSMSSMSYQSPDASQDVLQKKGNISSFFKPSINSLKPGAKSPVVSSCGKPAATAQTSAEVKADAVVGEQSRDEVSEARQSPGDASAGPADQQEPAVTHVMQPGRHAEQATSSEHPQTQVEDNVVDLVENEEGKAEKTDSDILNTDDAGGIGLYICYLCSACLIGWFLRLNGSSVLCGASLHKSLAISCRLHA